MQSVLALYAAGRATGVVLEVGDSCAYSQAIFEGVFLDSTVHRGQLAGSDMSRHLMHLLHIDRPYQSKGMGGVQLTQAALLEATYLAKERYAQVGAQPAGMPPEDVSFTLPDGREITITGANRNAAVEPLFSPTLLLNSPEALGVHELVAKSINQAELDLRRELAGSIILSGGGTCIAGFEERMRGEMKQIVTTMNTDVVANEERATGTWIGGTILATLDSFEESCMSNLDYAEEGATYVHEKFAFAGRS